LSTSLELTVASVSSSSTLTC